MLQDPAFLHGRKCIMVLGVTRAPGFSTQIPQEALDADGVAIFEKVLENESHHSSICIRHHTAENNVRKQRFNEKRLAGIKLILKLQDEEEREMYVKEGLEYLCKRKFPEAGVHPISVIDYNTQCKYI
jgi:hypothetical protein